MGIFEIYRNSKIMRITSIILAALLFVSTVAVTLAYIINNQHRDEYVTADNRTFAVYLQKYEKNAAGEMTAAPVKDAEFILFTLNGGDRTQYGTSTYMTNENGRIMVEGLNKGKYLFLETNTTYAYDYDQSGNEYPFTINDNSNDVIYVPVYNQRRTADLTVKKTVKNSDGSPDLAAAQLAQDFTFTFTLTGEIPGIKENIDDPDVPAEYDYEIRDISNSVVSTGKIKSGDTFKLKHSQTAVIKGLPVGAEYAVIETPVQGYTISSKNPTGSIPREGAAAEYINTFNVKKGSLEISKTVTGETDSTQVFDFTVTFTDSGTYNYTKDSTSHPFTSGGTISLKHGESVVFDSLPEGVGYTVVETAVTGYTSTIDRYIGTVGGVVLPFVNHKDSDEITTGYLSITKKVTGSGADTSDEFTFNLTFTDSGAAVVPASLTYKINGTGAAIPFINGEKITLKHDQTAVFADLPAGLVYTITEDAKEGYTSTIDEVRGAVPESETADEGAKVTFVNIKEIVPDTILTVKKIVEGAVPAADTEKEFEFTVTIDGVSETIHLKNGETSKEFTVAYDAVYSVNEKNYFADGYIKETIVNGYGTADGEKIEVVQTNTYVGTVFTEIPVEKIWNMNGYTGIAKPDFITITVKNGDTVKAQQKITEADANPPGGNWKWTFKLPKFEADGITPIDYTISEVSVPGFKTTVSKNGDGYNITNKYEPVTTAVKVPVQKTITGDPTSPQAFKFDLQAVTEGAPMPTGSTGGKKTITINGEGKADFSDIIFAAPGTWVYTIKEQAGTASGYTYDNTVYTLTVTTSFAADNLTLDKTVTFEKDTGAGKVAISGISDANPLTFNNAYVTSTPTETYYTPTVSKVITGNSPVTDPANFIFTLAANDNAFPSAKENKVEIKGEGSQSFGAIKFTEPGVFTYTIKEFAGNAKGYTYDDSVYTLTVTVVKDSNNNLSASAKYTKNGSTATETTATFVNRHDYTPTGETVTISGQKEWRHGENIAPENQPKSITIYVKAGDTILIEWTVTENEHWAWSFAVDRYDASGSEIAYTIEEKAVSGYRTQIDGYSIINRHNSLPKQPDEPPFPPAETITIKGKKVWNHMQNPKDYHPDSVTIQLYDGNTVMATQTVTANENWKYSFTMPQYDTDGREIVYRIDEVKVDGYGKYISGNDIINTYGYQDYQDPPKTGDESNLWVWVFLMIASAGLLIATVIWGKKRPKALSKH